MWCKNEQEKSSDSIKRGPGNRWKPSGSKGPMNSKPQWKVASEKLIGNYNDAARDWTLHHNCILPHIHWLISPKPQPISSIVWLKVENEWTLGESRWYNSYVSEATPMTSHWSQHHGLAIWHSHYAHLPLLSNFTPFKFAILMNFATFAISHRAAIGTLQVHRHLWMHLWAMWQLASPSTKLLCQRQKSFKIAPFSLQPTPSHSLISLRYCYNH